MRLESTSKFSVQTGRIRLLHRHTPFVAAEFQERIDESKVVWRANAPSLLLKRDSVDIITARCTVAAKANRAIAGFRDKMSGAWLEYHQRYIVGPEI